MLTKDFLAKHKFPNDITRFIGWYDQFGNKFKYTLQIPLETIPNIDDTRESIDIVSAWCGENLKDDYRVLGETLTILVESDEDAALCKLKWDAV